MDANQDNNGDSQSGTPQAFLNSVVGQSVWVRLNSGVDYKGTYLPSFRKTLSVVPFRNPQWIMSRRHRAGCSGG